MNSPLHHYQIGAIFLFVFGFFLFFPFYLFVEKSNLNILDWQWYFFWPWMLFYIIYCLAMRAKIPKEELRNPLKRPIGHWVLLGLTTLAIYLQPTNLHNLQAINLAFIILTIFVADGYWDFKTILKK
jgi:energy-coupling factor transporter transmembrane protein EcfT